MFNFHTNNNYLYIYIFDLKGNLVQCIPYKAPQPEATKKLQRRWSKKA